MNLSPKEKPITIVAAQETQIAAGKFDFPPFIPYFHFKLSKTLFDVGKHEGSQKWRAELG